MLRLFYIGFAALLTVAGTAHAQEPASFFKGKTITLLVGYGVGGGYDIYARLLSRVMGKYIPGNPNIIVQNMPGAGSLRAANYLYRVAAKDGTVFGTFSRTMPLIGLRDGDPNVQFDPRKFTWLGSSSSFANDAYILIARRDAAVKSIEDARKPGGPQLIVGSTADTSTSDSPIVLRDMLGFNIKLIPGYADSGQLYLAMERGEVEARTTALSAVQSNKPDWIKPGGPMQVLVDFGRLSRHPNFPDAPMASELANTPADKRLIEILETPFALSRPFAAPPEVPADRAKALQTAFLAAHKDPEFLAEAERLDIDVSPIGSDQIQTLINRIADTPKDQLQSIEKLMQGGG
jgi:tripartite-type tricarboxylate transporter receptor subunit TctC